MESIYLTAIKRDYSKGRTEFACFFDRFIFCSGVFVTAYLLLASGGSEIKLRIILSALTAIIVFVVIGIFRENRIRKHEAMMRSMIREELSKYKLLVCERTVLLTEILKKRADAVLIQSFDELTVNDVAGAVRNAKENKYQSVSIFSFERPSKEAEAFIEVLSNSFPIKHVSIFSNSDFADLAYVSDEEISSEIIRRSKKERKHLINIPISAAIGQDRLIKYFTLGGVTYLLSFIVKYGLYMRIFSFVLVMFAGICITVRKFISKK